MTLVFALWLLLALHTKHLIFDFLVRPSLVYKNRVTFLHIGGTIHAAVHATVTALILLPFFPLSVIVPTTLLEFLMHYLIDWTKVRVVNRRQTTPQGNEDFWQFLGVDQYLHQLSYLLIICILMGPAVE